MGARARSRWATGQELPAGFLCAQKRAGLENGAALGRVSGRDGGGGAQSHLPATALPS